MHKSAYGCILWEHDIYYEIFRLFSNFPPITFYFDRQSFSNKQINLNNISNTLSLNFQRSFSVLLFCVCDSLHSFSTFVLRAINARKKFSMFLVIIE